MSAVGLLVYCKQIRRSRLLNVFFRLNYRIVFHVGTGGGGNYHKCLRGHLNIDCILTEQQAATREEATRTHQPLAGAAQEPRSRCAQERCKFRGGSNCHDGVALFVVQ